MNDKGVCRTAPATPGLLKMYLMTFGWFYLEDGEENHALDEEH